MTEELRPELILEEKHLLLDYLHMRVRHSIVQYRNSVIQLFRADKTGKVPEAVGSGVLLRLDNCYFALTAAHVIKQFSEVNPPFTYRTGVLNEIYLAGEMKSVAEIDVNKYPEDLDMGFIQLADESIEKLGKENFLSYYDILPYHAGDTSVRYLMMGFPETKTTIYTIGNTVGKVKARPLNSICKLATPADYQQFGIQNKYHLAYRYDKKLRFAGGNPNNKSPNPEGISGGALFFAPNLAKLSADKIIFKLVGIIIHSHSYPQAQYRVNTIVRIDCFLDFIISIFPDLSFYRKGKPIVKLNIL